MKSLSLIMKAFLSALFLLQHVSMAEGQLDCTAVPGSHALRLPPPKFPDFIQSFGATIDNFAVLFGGSEPFKPLESSCAHKVNWGISNAALCSPGNQTNYIEGFCNPPSTSRPPISVSGTTASKTASTPSSSSVPNTGISVPLSISATTTVGLTSTGQGWNGTEGPVSPAPVVGGGVNSTAVIAGVICSVGGVFILAGVIAALVCRLRGGAQCCSWFHSIKEMKDLRRQKSELRPIAETPVTSSPTTPGEITSGAIWNAEGTNPRNGSTHNEKMGKDNFILLREDSSASAVFPDIYADGSSPSRTGPVTSPSRSLRINLSVIGESSSDLTLRKPSQSTIPSEEKSPAKPDIDLMRFNSISVDASGKRGKDKGRETELFEILDVAEEEEALAYKKQKQLEEDVDILDGIPDGTLSSGNTVSSELVQTEHRPADQTLKRNLIHYVAAKEKPVVAKKTSFAQTAAKQKMLQRQKSVTLPDEDNTHGTLSRKYSDGDVVDDVEMGFDNKGFIPDTPVADDPSRQNYDDNAGTVDDDDNNVDEETRPTKIPLNIPWDDWVNQAFDQVLNPEAAGSEPSRGANSVKSPVEDSHKSRRSQLRHADSDVNNESVPFESPSPTSSNSDKDNNNDEAGVPDVNFEPVSVSAAAAKFETSNKSPTRTGKYNSPKVTINKNAPTMKFSFSPTSPKVQNTLPKKHKPPAIPTKVSKPSSASSNLFPTSPVTLSPNRTRLSNSVSSPTSASPPARSLVLSASNEAEVASPPVASIREQFEQNSNKQTKSNEVGLQNGSGRPVSNNLNKK